LLHVASEKGGVTVSKGNNMSMLNNTTSYFFTYATIRGSVRSGLAWLGHMINGVIAMVIAYREHQVNLAILQSLNDKQLSDIGLQRSQIDEGLSEAGKARSELQARFR
jgi:uncharacterized protein YjiS (DUF1127 family)